VRTVCAGGLKLRSIIYHGEKVLGGINNEADQKAASIIEYYAWNNTGKEENSKDYRNSDH